MRRIGITVLLFAAPLLHAMTYRVEWRGAGDAGTAVLHARRVDATAEPIRRDITVPSTGTLSGIDEGTWHLSVESERAWIAPVYVQAKDATRGEAVLTAWPAARLHVPLMKTDEVPETTKVLFTPAQEPLRGERLDANVDCPVRENEILCTVPAGTWDIQFAPAGFVPQYRWNIALPANRVTKLEPLPLLKGASVIGTVTRIDRSLALPADTRIRLVPSTMVPHEARAYVREVKPNAKGFFQFVGVPPGQYFLSATAKSLTSDNRQIVVIANRTAELRSPLIIDTPRSVRVAITPKVDPDGKPWLAELMVQRAGSQTLDTYTMSKANLDGLWEQKGLPDGEYLLTISRHDGAQWASRWITVLGGDLDVPFDIPALRVEGTVSYGDQPIAARLTFGGEFGSPRQLLISDDDGKFSGMLPRPEKEPWDVFVESEAPPMRLTLHDVRGETSDDDPVVRFDVRLPRTAVTGVVVRADGSPAEYALLSIEGNGTVEQTGAGKDGAFQISGLSPGSYAVRAEAFLMTSDLVPFEVREDDTPPLRIVVRDVQQVRGRIVSTAGVPVIGATIGALPVDVPRTGLGFKRTNESGAFVLQMPPGVSMMDIFVAPPGFATIIGRIPVRTDKGMEIAVDQHGGALIAELGGPGDGLLTHEGATWSLQVLTRMASGFEEVAGKGRVVTLPSMHPGQYSLCFGQSCKSGYVPPHGTLRLAFE